MMQGRWQSQDYFVLDRVALTNGVGATLGVHDSTHPVMSGVNNFDGGALGWRPAVVTLTSGATLIAEWSDGLPLVAVKCVNGHARIDLGFYPVSSTLYASGWLATTDGALLMANALTFAANTRDSDGDGTSDNCDTPTVHNRTQVTDHFTIQDALNASVDGDVIEADPGTYHETIIFNGLAVTLRSTQRQSGRYDYRWNRTLPRGAMCQRRGF